MFFHDRRGLWRCDARPCSPAAAMLLLYLRYYSSSSIFFYCKLAADQKRFHIHTTVCIRTKIARGVGESGSFLKTLRLSGSNLSQERTCKSPNTRTATTISMVVIGFFYLLEPRHNLTIATYRIRHFKPYYCSNKCGKRLSHVLHVLEQTLYDTKTKTSA